MSIRQKIGNLNDKRLKEVKRNAYLSKTLREMNANCIFFYIMMVIKGMHTYILKNIQPPDTK